MDPLPPPPSVPTGIDASLLEKLAPSLPLPKKRGRPAKPKPPQTSPFLLEPMLPSLTTKPSTTIPILKRGRGRPKGSKNKKHTQELDLTSLLADVTIPFPTIDVDPFSIDEKTPVVKEAAIKFEKVVQGEFSFGHRIDLSTFKFVDAPFQMPATDSNIILMYMLCSSHVATTVQGIVGVYPVTVNSKYPCLAINIEQFKTLCWRVFPGLSHLITSATILNDTTTFSSKFNVSENPVLTELTGVEPSGPKSNFILISAKWFDVMKFFFVKEDFQLVHLADVFSDKASKYPLYKQKFQENRLLWLGYENVPCINEMLASPSTKCRAAVLQARLGGISGPAWDLPATPIKQVYSDMSYCFGIQCWREQLEALYSAYTYFTCRTPSMLRNSNVVQHLRGLMALDASVPVLSRSECMARGIFDDRFISKSLREIVRDMRELRKTAPDLKNYFS